MTSIDFSKALATLGGTLSARALGGPQAAQQYLAQLNKQEESRLAREYDESQKSRDREFTLTRDRLAAEEAQEARKSAQAFQTGERVASQGFQAGQAADQQTFTLKRDRLVSARQAARDARLGEQQRNAIAAQGEQQRLNTELENAHATVRALQEHERRLELGAQSHENDVALANVRAELAAAEGRAARADQAIQGQANRDAAAANLAAQIAAKREQQALDHQYAIGLAVLQNDFAQEGQARQQAHSIDLSAFNSANRMREDDNRTKNAIALNELDDSKTATLKATTTYGSIVAREDSGFMLAAIRRMQAVLPRNPDGSPQEVDFDKREQTIAQLTIVMTEGGFSSEATAASYDAGQRDIEAINALTGGAVDASKMDIAGRAKVRQQHASGGQEAQAINAKAAEIAADLEDLSGQANLSPEAMKAREEASAKAQVALAQRFANWRTKYGVFTGEGGSLAATSEALESALNNAGRLTNVVQDGQINALAGTYNPASNSGAIFGPRYLEDEQAFNRLNRSNAVSDRAAAWNKSAVAAAGLSDSDLKHAGLDPQQRAVIDRLKGYSKDGQLDLQSVNDRIRRHLLAGEQAEADALQSMVQGAARLDLGGAMVRINQGREQQQAVQGVETLAAATMENSLVRLFPQGEGRRTAILAAVQQHGFETPGSDTKRGPQNEQENQIFLSRYVNSDEGMNALGQSVLMTMQSIQDPDVDADAMLDGKISHAVDGLGVSNNAAIRRKLKRKVKEMLGQDPNGVSISSEAEAVGEAIDVDFAPTDRLMKAASALSSLSPDNAAKWNAFYGASVLGPTREERTVLATGYRGRDRALLSALEDIKQRRTEVPGETPDQRAAREQASARAEASGRVVTRDLIDLWASMDRGFESVNNMHGSLRRNAAAKHASQSIRHLGDVGGAKPTSVDGDYMFGEDSLYQASMSQSDAEKLLSAGDRSQLERLDYFRAADISQIPNLSLSQRDILAGVQQQLRQLDLPAAMAAINNGFNMEDYGLTVNADPEAAQRQILAQRVPSNPRDMLDVNAQRLQLRRAKQQAVALDTSGSVYADTDPRDGLAYGMVDETVQEALLADIDKGLLALDAFEAAKNSPLLSNLAPTMASIIPSEAFGSRQSLAEAVKTQLPAITGQSADAIGLTIEQGQQLAENIGNAPTNAAGLDMVFETFFNKAAKQSAERLGMSFAGATDKDSRDMVARVMSATVTDMRDKVRALNRTMLERMTLGELNYEDLPGPIKARVAQSNFDEAIERVRSVDSPLARADEMLLLSFQVFLADSATTTGTLSER